MLDIVFGVGGTPKGLHLDAIICLFIFLLYFRYPKWTHAYYYVFVYIPQYQLISFSVSFFQVRVRSVVRTEDRD